MISHVPSSDKFIYDVAISLCKEDIDYARKLVRALNPSLKVFFYEERQEELISNCGPEKFSKIFKEQSRIVVILSRKEWGETFYTDIERNAIIARTAVKNEGYNFLMVLPMIKNEIPSWYPQTHIYADPFNFTIDQLAKFVEFKVASSGGIVKVLTLEDVLKNLLERIEEKKKVVDLQLNDKAIQYTRNEIIRLKKLFNEKIELIKNLNERIAYLTFYEQSSYGNFELREYILECRHSVPDEDYYNAATTQDFTLSFEISKILPDNKGKKSLVKEERIFYYSEYLKGWAMPILQHPVSVNEYSSLFHNRFKTKYYELRDVKASELMVDQWFRELLKSSMKEIYDYI